MRRCKACSAVNGVDLTALAAAVAGTGETDANWTLVSSDRACHTHPHTTKAIVEMIVNTDGILIFSVGLCIYMLLYVMVLYPFQAEIVLGSIVSAAATPTTRSISNRVLTTPLILAMPTM